MPTVRTGARGRSVPAEANPAVIAAIAAVLATQEDGPVAVRVRPVWPDPGPWRLVGRRDTMRGGWPW